ETVVPEVVVPETMVVDAVVPEPRANGDAVVVETVVPEVVVPETMVVDAVVPEPRANGDAVVVETVVPEVVVPEVVVPETMVVDAVVPETVAGVPRLFPTVDLVVPFPGGGELVVPFPGGGELVSPSPRAYNRSAAGRPWPAVEDGVCSCCENGGSPLEPWQPVEREATLAVLSSRTVEDESADRMRRWFGPFGDQLLDKATGEHPDALASFMLGILLVNNEAHGEGALFLQQAGKLMPDLTLSFDKPPFRRGDVLHGSIVRDICNRVSDAVERAGYPRRARSWRVYAAKVDGKEPLALWAMIRGRHARTVSRKWRQYVEFDSKQVERIRTAYWRARVLEAEDTRFTNRDQLALAAQLANGRGATIHAGIG
ncbi:hypothetical protein, partial [Microbispora sp. H10949]|uniref:hypothetical protein n=1 Tax=Microbispora sp. H10949 TaxID=2729111 RepID=UPI001C72857D